MDALPQRPRSHRLDEEGKLALSAGLPSHFRVTHTQQLEYGIDGDVEVFDKESGTATGLRFYFQLKSTDEHDIERALKIALKTPTVNYFRSANLPVLMVLYHSPARELYLRWFHHYDPYYESAGRGGLSAKTITFHFSREDSISNGRGERLAPEAQAWLELKRRDLVQPLPLYTVSEHPSISSIQLAVAVRQAVNGLPRLLQVFASAPPPGQSKMLLRSDALVVSILDTTSLTLHEDLVSNGLQQAADDACFAIAMALLHARIDSPAVRLATHVALRSSLVLHPDFAFFLTSALKATNRYAEALNLAAAMAARDEEHRLLAQILLLAIMGNESALDGAERAQAEAVYGQLIDKARSSHDAQAEAASHYSLGKLLMRFGEYDRSFSHLNWARRVDDSYSSRSYYWEDVAGCLFLSGRPAASARAYRVAMAIDPASIRLKCLLADSLMLSGRLQESYETFQAALRDDPSVAGYREWRLKVTLVGVLRSELDAPAEVPPVSFEPYDLDSMRRAGAGEELAYRLHELLSAAPLQPRVWFDLGVTYNENGEREEARKCFTAAALLAPGDAEAWVNAIMLSLPTDESTSRSSEASVELDAVLGAAFTALGNELMLELQRQLDEQDVPTDFRDSFLSTVDVVLASIAPADNPMVVRLPDEDGAQIEVQVEDLVG